MSPSHLREVAKRLPNWRLLAPHLHITQQQVEEIIDDYPSDIQVQGLKCLQKWNCCSDKATYGTLINAIHKMGNTDLIDCICTLLRTCSSPPSQFNTIQHYAELLKLSYSRLRLPYIFESFTEDDHSGPSPSNQYVNLVMTTRERVQTGRVDKDHLKLALHGDTHGMADYMRKNDQKVSIDVTDIFSINKGKFKIILIEGAPGSGKTTLSRYIVQEWAADDSEKFQQFTLVLVIQLRDKEIQEAQGLAGLLPFEFNLEERKAIIEDVRQRNGEGVLLLFDGWDELPEEKQRKSIFLDILKHPGMYHLTNAAVLITSRTTVSTTIQEFATTRIEILGFTPRHIKRYIRESLPENKAKNLISAIRKDPVLKENCYLPLSLAIITHTYISFNHKLPTTFCRIIIQLALSCLYRHIKKCTPDGYLYQTLNSFNDLKGSIEKEFKSLCERAYNSILREEYSFDDPDMPTLGLMQSVQSFAVRGKSTQHYFLHLSLHELCAAWHLVTLPPSEQERVLLRYLMGRTSQMENVLGFFSALGGWNSQNINILLSNIELLKVITRYSSAVYASPRLTHLHYFHEAQSDELCKSLHPMIQINFSDSSGHTSRDIVGVRYIVSKKKLESLALSYISDEHLKALEPTLRKNMPEQLNISNGLHLGRKGWKIIADLMKQTAMKYFSCCIAEITSEDIDCLGTALQYCQLTSFTMNFVNIGYTRLVQLTEYVKNSELTYLDLDCCEIGDEGIESLSAALPSTKLGTLSLGGNNISSRGLTVLANALMMTPNFRRIKFETSKADKIIPGRDIQDFLERLLHHPRFFEISINVRTINETFKEYFTDFNRRRMESGLQEVNMDIRDSVVPDDVVKGMWLNHFSITTQ